MRTQGSILALVLCLSAMPEAADAGDIKGKVTTAARDNRNVVVYLDRLPGKTFSPPSEPAVLNQVNLAFDPHVLVIQAGTKVKFPNNDDIRHSVFGARPVDGKRLNLGSYPAGTSREAVFNTPGPVLLLCNVHLEMSAYIFVVETPYFALTDSSGNFTIKDVPPGNYTLKTWHENKRSKPQSKPNVVVGAGGAVTVDLDLTR